MKLHTLKLYPRKYDGLPFPFKLREFFHGGVGTPPAHEGTPLSKTREGDPLPPCLQQDRPPPPSGFTHTSTASYGNTTESPSQHPKQKGGGGYPSRSHAFGHSFVWSHDEENTSRPVIWPGGGGPSCARRGTHPLPLSKK